jgi:hypothetical protein
MITSMHNAARGCSAVLIRSDVLAGLILDDPPVLPAPLPLPEEPVPPAPAPLWVPDSLKTSLGTVPATQSVPSPSP